MYLRLLSFLLVLSLVPPTWAAAPSRTYTYTTGQTIDPSQVTTNEDNVFSYLQAGVDTYAAGSVNAAAIADNAVGASEIAAGAVDVADLTTTGTAADDKVLVADSVSSGTWRTLTNCTDTSGNHLNYTQSTNSFSCGTSSGASTTIGDRVSVTAGNFTTTSTSLVDVTSLSITLTTGANPVLVGGTFDCYTNTLNSDVRLNVNIDGTLVLGTTGNIVNTNVAGDDHNCSFVAMSADLTAASHTFKLQMSVNANTGTLTCTNATPCNFWVDEIAD